MCTAEDYPVEYAHAIKAGYEAANRSMQAGGRTHWNTEDLNAAWAEFYRLHPYDGDLLYDRDNPKQL